MQLRATRPTELWSECKPKTDGGSTKRNNSPRADRNQVEASGCIQNYIQMPMRPRSLVHTIKAPLRALVLRLSSQQARVVM